MTIKVHCGPRCVSIPRGFVLVLIVFVGGEGTMHWTILLLHSHDGCFLGCEHRTGTGFGTSHDRCSKPSSDPL
jgi:hypothetical protein